MSFPALDLISQGLKVDVFGNYVLAVLFALFILFMILSSRGIPKAFIMVMLIPIIMVFSSYIPWLFMTTMLLLGFILGNALIKLFRQEG